MKKVLFALSLMGMVSAASAATTPTAAQNASAALALAKAAVQQCAQQVIIVTSMPSVITQSPVVVVPPPAITPAPVPTPAPAPAPTQAPTPVPVVVVPPVTMPTVAALPAMDLSGFGLWNWDAVWFGSEWGNNLGPIPWKNDHIARVGTDTVLTMDANGAPQLQGMNGTVAHTAGLWEAEVTLPTFHDGVVVAPLWIYNDGNKDEIDFEFAGRGGLDVTMHVYVNGQDQRVSKRYFEGQDLSGQRHRFGIEVKPDVVNMWFDGKVLHTFEKAKQTSFVSAPLKPWIELWAADPNNSGFVSWVGKWLGLKPGESMKMIVHGYGFR